MEYKSYPYFEGSIQVKRRKLLFNLQFRQKNNEDIDSKHCFENIDFNSFEKILLFAFYNQPSYTLHYIRLISKNLYILCSKIHQNRLFSKVDYKTVSLINGLSNSRRMIRYRFINGIDYGLDGQYFIGNQYNGQNTQQYNTFYDGLPIDSNKPPRTQPSLHNDWIFNEKLQCIEWNQCEKFHRWTEWLIYLINNILHPKYILFGEIKFDTGMGGTNDDKGIIKIKNDGKNNVKTIPKYISEQISKSKQKDYIWPEIVTVYPSPDKTWMKAINIKIWIENHKTIKTFIELKEIVKNSNLNSKKRKLKIKNDNGPSKKRMKRKNGMYCKFGCGQICNPGFTLKGNAFDTCCKSCAISKGGSFSHDNHCNVRNNV